MTLLSLLEQILRSLFSLKSESLKEADPGRAVNTADAVKTGRALTAADNLEAAPPEKDRGAENPTSSEKEDGPEARAKMAADLILSHGGKLPVIFPVEDYMLHPKNRAEKELSQRVVDCYLNTPRRVKISLPPKLKPGKAEKRRVPDGYGGEGENPSPERLETPAAAETKTPLQKEAAEKAPKTIGRKLSPWKEALRRRLEDRLLRPGRDRGETDGETLASARETTLHLEKGPPRSAPEKDGEPIPLKKPPSAPLSRGRAMSLERRVKERMKKERIQRFRIAPDPEARLPDLFKKGSPFGKVIRPMEGKARRPEDKPPEPGPGEGEAANAPPRENPINPPFGLPDLKELSKRFAEMEAEHLREVESAEFQELLGLGAHPKEEEEALKKGEKEERDLNAYRSLLKRKKDRRERGKAGGPWGTPGEGSFKRESLSGAEKSEKPPPALHSLVTALELGGHKAPETPRWEEWLESGKKNPEKSGAAGGKEAGKEAREPFRGALHGENESRKGAGRPRKKGAEKLPPLFRAEKPVPREPPDPAALNRLLRNPGRDLIKILENTPSEILFPLSPEEPAPDLPDPEDEKTKRSARGRRADSSVPLWKLERARKIQRRETTLRLLEESPPENPGGGENPMEGILKFRRSQAERLERMSGAWKAFPNHTLPPDDRRRLEGENGRPLPRREVFMNIYGKNWNEGFRKD
ncbi:MAG: hypothetical protein LBR53_01425 [Deltaproteobacteria bacterium]|jgi:hypothetical protein|nr:hypothetical protein [Deltaproteobacteria bacterium]